MHTAMIDNHKLMEAVVGVGHQITTLVNALARAGALCRHEFSFSRQLS